VYNSVEKAMTEDITPNQSAWLLDQLAKSEYFHQKLHLWGMIEIAETIDQIQGEKLTWNKSELGVSEKAWDKVIHSGIKPVIVFAHPDVLENISRSVSYYRMLSMASQKSMKNIGMSVESFEVGARQPNHAKALAIANHLNNIISKLLETDENIEEREFDLWRGMAAGSQAQGGWGNVKGDRIEVVVRGMIRKRVLDKNLVEPVPELEGDDSVEFNMNDGRLLKFASEPDVAIYENGDITVALEIKGGIDTAGVLERVGAAIKSLGRAKDENPQAVTLLLLQGISMSVTAEADLRINQEKINHWFTIENFLENEEIREHVYSHLHI
jgi:hypothetical protein